MEGCIVITPEQIYSGEDEVISAITAAGSRVHIRKPQLETNTIRLYTESVLKHSHAQNISLHRNFDIVNEFNIGGYHAPYSEIKKHTSAQNIIISCSTHSLEEAKEAESLNVEYYFLSPIFDSISKQGYKSSFTDDELTIFLSTARPCVALGGIDFNKLHRLTGFRSIALLGAVWVIEDKRINVTKSIKQFEKIDKLWRELKNCNI